MKFLKKISSGVALTAFGLLYSPTAYSQTEATLSMMDNLYQSSYYSPFNESDFNLSIGLPVLSSIQADVQHSGFSISDFYPNGIEQPLDPNAVIDGMRQNEFVNANLQVDLFHLYWQYGKRAFSFHVKEHVNTRFTYAKDMLDLAWNGNGAFIDEDADFSGFGARFQHYREYAIGFSNKWDKLFLSARGKLLFGKYAANLKANDLTIGISDDIYQHTVSGDIEANYGGFGIDLINNPDDLDEDQIQEYLLNRSNTGLGLDLGASYDVSTKFQVNAAITNIGFIGWKDNPTNYAVEDDFAFEGVDVFDIIFKNDLDSLEEGFETYLDSIVDRFNDSKIDSTNNKFRTSTPWNISVGARYEFLRNTYAVGRMSIYNSSGLRGALTVGVYHDLLRWLNVGVTNTITNKKITNVGAGIVIKPGPFQIYAVTDFLTAAQFTSAKQVNVRVGMNLVFGKAAKPEKLTSVLD